MIQDKDFTLRLIRQFTQALETLILDKPEESLMQKDLDYDSLMKDIFRMNFDEVSSMSNEELINLVQQRESKDHKDYYEMLGNLFYWKGKELSQTNFLLKSKIFYELYLQTSGIFAMQIINRINEVKKLA